MRVRTLLAVAAAVALAFLWHESAKAAHPLPTPTPPIIYHGVARPLCAALVRHVRPVVGMMLENDHTIGKSPSLLSQYNRDLDDVQANGSSASQAERDLTLYHLEQLVTPLANNVNAMQRELEDPSVFPPNPQGDDEKMLDAMRAELLKALATQAVALDLINGYVQTQQLAELQQEGTGASEMHAITGTDVTYSPTPTTPNPMLQDSHGAGLAPNPYAIDPYAVPGITGSVGSTPVTRLVSAMHWLQAETTRRENIAAQTIGTVAGSCRAHPTVPGSQP
jgi:hypothetical protein